MVRNYESMNQVSKSDAREGARVKKIFLFTFGILIWSFLLLNQEK